MGSASDSRRPLLVKKAGAVGRTHVAPPSNRIPGFAMRVFRRIVANAAAALA
jgi:hypothetical protein